MLLVAALILPEKAVIHLRLELRLLAGDVSRVGSIGDLLGGVTCGRLVRVLAL